MAAGQLRLDQSLAYVERGGDIAITDDTRQPRAIFQPAARGLTRDDAAQRSGQTVKVTRRLGAIGKKIERRAKQGSRRCQGIGFGRFILPDQVQRGRGRLAKA